MVRHNGKRNKDGTACFKITSQDLIGRTPEKGEGRPTFPPNGVATQETNPDVFTATRSSSLSYGKGRTGSTLYR
jgi:hypothetical protein